MRVTRGRLLPFFLIIGLARAGLSAARADEASPWPGETIPTPSASPPTEAAASTPTTPGRWDGEGGAIFLGYSPLYLAQLGNSNRLNSGSLPTFEAGVEFISHLTLSLRYSKATVPSVEIYNPTTFVTSYVPNGSLSVYELSAGLDIPLNEPYRSLGRFQLFIPIRFGSAYASVDAAPSSFSAVSFDTAAGIGARYYAWNFLRVNLSAQYHLGIPLTTFSGGSTAAPNSNLYDPASETLKAGLSGFELCIGVAFLFPGSSPSEAPQEITK